MNLPEQHLHIVCLDVPYPVDYGGVFDLFYKIKTLSDLGVKIHLHCFEYGRGQQPELNKYCVEVTYYSRLTGWSGIKWPVPYMVASRANTLLLKNLLRDDYPILLEGMHCTYFLYKKLLPAQRCFVRLHNVEYQYYRQLAETSQSFLKKIYFNIESKLLKKYEATLSGKAFFWPVTQKDKTVFEKEFHYKNIEYLPLFLPEYTPSWPGEMGGYCLYHGNLGVPENEEAAIWLLQHVFQKIELPFIIAGKNPTARLQHMVGKTLGSMLKPNPDEAEMQELIKNAQINVLPSLNSTGIKLKLINALYNGRHCLVNTAGAEGSGLEKCCAITDDPLNMQLAVKSIFQMPFTNYMYSERVKQLKHVFNNRASANTLLSCMFTNRQA